MVELEEIKCPLCKEQFSQQVRMPLLLPDCGHSYCIQCIEEHSTEAGFQPRQTTVTKDEDEDLTAGDSPSEEKSASNDLLEAIETDSKDKYCYDPHSGGSWPDIISKVIKLVDFVSLESSAKM